MRTPQVRAARLLLRDCRERGCPSMYALIRADGATVHLGGSSLIQKSQFSTFSNRPLAIFFWR